MTPSHWKRVRSAFDRVIERSPASRLDHLHAEITADPSLRPHLPELVEKHRSVDDPLFDWAATPPDASPAEPLFHDGQTLASRFRIVRFLGRGGMGEVYEAVDTTLYNRPVALKTISAEIRHNPDSSRRFLREVELAQRVTHPNICRIHDIFHHAIPDPATGGEQIIQFLTMQLLIGETLSEHIAAHGAFLCVEAMDLLRRLADALEAAHSAGVIHRDFKPSNVILVRDGIRDQLRPVITDFGVAVRTDRALDTEGDHALGTNTRAGTPEYASPEQRAGGRVTAATDVYALGVVALEMLTGHTGDRSLEPLSATQREAFARCLSDDPAKRFASPSEFVNALAGDPQPPAGAHWILSRRALITGLGATAAISAGGFITRKYVFPPTQISTLSILPFEGDSGGSALPGIQEELIRVLLQSKRLRIIAPYSTAFLRPPYNYEKIASILPADAFLSGVLSSADVLLKLVRRGGAVLWQRKFDRHQQLYALHREIQAAVIGAVDASEATQLMRNSYVPSQAGYLAYTNARALLNRHNSEDVAQAKILFNEAIHHDAAFSPAWAGFGYTLLVSEEMAEARAAADRAITLDDQCAEAFLVKGMVLHRGDWKWNEAQAAFQRALDLEPYNVRCYQWIGATLCDLGEFGRAIPQLNLAVQLDPVSFNPRLALGICLLYARRYDDAIASLNQGIAMAKASSADTARPYPSLAACWLMKGERDKALQYFRHAVSLEPANMEVNCNLVFGVAKCGHLLEARATLEKAMQLPDAGECPFDIAIAHLGMGDRDRAFEYLNRAFEMRDSDMVQLKSSIYMESIKSDPRYVTLIGKMGLT